MPRRTISDSTKYKQTSISSYFGSNSKIQTLKQVKKKIGQRQQVEKIVFSESDTEDFKITHKKAADRSKSKGSKKKCVKPIIESDSSSDVEFISCIKSEISIESNVTNTGGVQILHSKEQHEMTNVDLSKTSPKISIGVYSPLKKDQNNIKLNESLQDGIMDETLGDLLVTFNDSLDIPNATIDVSALQEADGQICAKRHSEETYVGPASSTVAFDATPPNITLIKKSGLEHKEEIGSSIPLNVILKIIKFVVYHNRLQKLLVGNEAIMLNNFLQLPRGEYIFVCLKLYTRMKKWYNILSFRTLIKLKLSDPEVMEMYECLREGGFVDTDYSSEPIDDLLLQLNVETLRELCREFKIPFAKLNKTDLVDKLLNNCNKQSTLTMKSSIRDLLTVAIKNKMGFCFKLNEDFIKILNKVHLLYSFTTNEYINTSDLYLFMSKIMDETIVMPEYSIDRSVEIFRSVDEFNSFQEAFQCYVSVLSAIDKKDLALTYQLCCIAYEQLKDIVERNIVDNRPSYLQKFTPGHKYTKALWNGIPYITKHYTESVCEWLIFLLDQHLFCQFLRGLWFSHLIMLQYTHLKKHHEATETLIAALKDTSLKKIHRMDINKRAEKIKKSKMHKISRIKFGEISSVQPIPIEKLPWREIDSQAFRSEVSGQKRNYYKKVDNGLEIYTVEGVALKYYKDYFDLNGIHCESSLLVTSFCVFFWDIIYDQTIPCVFISEIQSYPLDLYCSEFYTNRKNKIDKRLLQILHSWTDTDMYKFICDVWEKSSHRKSLIAWSVVDKPRHLFDMILCIGRIKVTKIFEHFLEDFGGYRSGLPDLFLWNTEEKKCKFVEVKGENDHLSAKQECWLDFLRSIGADVEVCHQKKFGQKYKKNLVLW
ncbi:hypothetical protein RI129_002307 [Pyrocoelia pectoralis]|uniref:Fanconi-associated nuclease n=1 Tax=Pyrocoelia pectoralis TaxID=417401 RepID=A0AAN7VFR9_9COLE